LAPKILEPVGRHFGVSDRVLNVLVPEVVLQSPCVVAIIGELKPTGMAKHVGVGRKWHPCSLADALDEAVGTDRPDRPRGPGKLFLHSSKGKKGCMEHMPIGR